MIRGYTIEHLLIRFPDDDSVLEAIMRNTADADGRRHCPSCLAPRYFKRIATRKCYQCCRCGHQHYPLAGTVMAGTKLPLSKWLRAVHLFYTHRSGVSAQMLQREVEVTFKVAWRMAHQIRRLMADETTTPLHGTMEADETYVGGRKRADSRRSVPKKTAVFGLLERGGRVRTCAVQHVNKPTLYTLIRENVASGTPVHSDEHSLDTKLPEEGYPYQSVLHKAYEWKRGEVSTNGIEGHWSRVKRTVRGAYVSVSPQWLQFYLNESSFQHNRRQQSYLIVEDLLARLMHPLPASSRKGPPGLVPTPAGAEAGAGPNNAFRPRPTRSSHSSSGQSSPLACWSCRNCS